MISEGMLQAGDRIFSVRQASQTYQVSISTVIKAYDLLEQEGVIACLPQSGYFVAHHMPRLSGRSAGAAPQTGATLQEPHAQRNATGAMSRVDIVMSTLRAIREFGIIPLGSPFPDPQLFPIKKIQHYEKSLAETHHDWGVLTDLPPGNPGLRQAIARRYLEFGMDIPPQEVVITHGATEGIQLCLQAVARPGDNIAIETPGYYALAHAVERLGMKPIEIATDPQQGMRLDALQAVCDNVAIKAVLLTSNFQNPLGALMPECNKSSLTQFLAERQIPLIEDDVYQELYFDSAPPKPLKFYDQAGLVLHCGSFSKSLAPGYRVGWVSAGRYQAALEQLMFLNSIAIASAPQIAISKWMRRAQHAQHLRQLRHTLKSNAILMRNCVEASFPTGTWISNPRGGYVLWLKLPGNSDALKLYHIALSQGISIAPGPVFSRNMGLTQYLRLNFSHPWTPVMEQAVRKLGELAHGL